MADDIQGTPVSSDAAPAIGSDSLSPTFETDTPDQGSDSAVKAGTDETAALRSELEDLKKRVSHGTLSYQQERQARQAIEQRMERWRKAGVDPDEIDRALAAAQGTLAPNQGGQGQPSMPANVLTQDQFNQQRILDRYELARDTLLEKHPEYDKPQIRNFIDSESARIAKAEHDEFGRVLSTPKEILGKAWKSFKEMEAMTEKSVVKKLTEQRQKVGAQGVVESAHGKPNVDRSGADEFKPETNESWAEKQRQQGRRLRGLA